MKTPRELEGIEDKESSSQNKPSKVNASKKNTFCKEYCSRCKQFVDSGKSGCCNLSNCNEESKVNNSGNNINNDNPVSFSTNSNLSNLNNGSITDTIETVIDYFNSEMLRVNNQEIPRQANKSIKFNSYQGKVVTTLTFQKLFPPGEIFTRKVLVGNITNNIFYLLKGDILSPRPTFIIKSTDLAAFNRDSDMVEGLKELYPDIEIKKISDLLKLKIKEGTIYTISDNINDLEDNEDDDDNEIGSLSEGNFLVIPSLNTIHSNLSLGGASSYFLRSFINVSNSIFDRFRLSQSQDQINGYYKKLTEDKNEDCLICLSKLKASSIVCELPCNHMFHKECIAPWFEKSKRCPVCKLSIV